MTLMVQLQLIRQSAVLPMMTAAVVSWTAVVLLLNAAVCLLMAYALVVVPPALWLTLYVAVTLRSLALHCPCLLPAGCVLLHQLAPKCPLESIKLC